MFDFLVRGAMQGGGVVVGALGVALLVEVGQMLQVLVALLAGEFVEAGGPVVEWLVDTAISAVFGLALGLIVVGVVLGLTRVFRRKPAGAAAH